MNVQMRLITSDNIEQLTSKSDSSISIPSKNIIGSPDKAGKFINKNIDEDVDDEYNEDLQIDTNEEDNLDKFDSINDTIVQHNIFNVGDTVVHVPSKNLRPWKIKQIDNSKKQENIIIFTLLMDNLGNNNDLPAKSIIQEKVFNNKTQSFNIPVYLTTSINEIKHFTSDEIIPSVVIGNDSGLVKDEEYTNIRQNVNKLSDGESGKKEIIFKLDNEREEESKDGDENQGIIVSDSVKTIKLN